MTHSWRHTIRLVALTALLAPTIAACAGGTGATVKRAAFTSKEYGVSVSPRVTTNPNPPKGGGRYQVGKPYTVKGNVYVPQENPLGYVASGGASWYGSDFHGRRTANGEIFSANALTGAHPTMPLPSYMRVTNAENGRSVVVRVNDRGPYMPGRIMDLSHRAAEMLGYVNNGHTQITAEYMGPAPLEGDDTRMLLATYDGPPVSQSTTRMASAGGHNSLADMAGNFFGGLFSYAGTTPQEQDAAIGTAHAAVNAVATGQDLQSWVASVDDDSRKIRMPLGVFADQSNAIALAEQFALLGAVDEDVVQVNGRVATSLTLTHLKPGVGVEDAINMARALGLNDVVLY